MPLTDTLAAIEEPFPGLRPYDTADSLVFFGRESHTEQLLRCLSVSRFLAVVGTSGSGKSSVVRAGLLPALYRGYLSGAGTGWRIAVLRPGSAPMANLNRALSSPDALGPDDEDARFKLLSSSSMGLVSVVREKHLKTGESLLVVVDQFEELFRYRTQTPVDSAEAALFVSILLQAADQFEVPIYVVLTMRSDFLGDCAQYRGLAETLSRNQYLIPRLTREQRQQAVERPLHLAGVEISTRLVQQLLNDSTGDLQIANELNRGGAPDPLPVLQHALMRTHRFWKESGSTGSIDIQHYIQVGRIENALDQHADSLYKTDLDPAGKTLAAKVFRALTTTELGRPIRRPTQLDRLYKIVQARDETQRAKVREVLNVFLRRENSLLVSSPAGELTPGSVIDIAHESLIWKWKLLQSWLREEAVSAEWFGHLAKDVQEDGALWRDPKLAHAERMAREQSWNPDWAAQYVPEEKLRFAQTQDFLHRSRAVMRREKLLWRGGAIILILALIAAAYGFYRVKVSGAMLQSLNAELTAQKNQQAEKENEVRAIQDQLKELKSQPQQTTNPLDLARREIQIHDLQDKLNGAKNEVDKLKAQQNDTAKLIAGTADLQTTNRALQERAKTLQDKLNQVQADYDKANAELAKLRSADKTQDYRPALPAQGQSAPPPVTYRSYEVRLKGVTVLKDGSSGATNWNINVLISDAKTGGAMTLLEWAGKSLDEDSKGPYLPPPGQGSATVSVQTGMTPYFTIFASHSNGTPKTKTLGGTFSPGDNIDKRITFPDRDDGDLIFTFSVLSPSSAR